MHTYILPLVQDLSCILAKGRQLTGGWACAPLSWASILWHLRFEFEDLIFHCHFFVSCFFFCFLVSALYWLCLNPLIPKIVKYNQTSNLFGFELSFRRLFLVACKIACFVADLSDLRFCCCENLLCQWIICDCKQIGSKRIWEFYCATF